MNRIELNRAVRADATELIAANRASQDYHLPWCTPFTDQAGFDAWFGRCLTGPHVGLIARERLSGRIVGVVNITEIVLGTFQGAYLAYYGMSDFARKGLMTEAVRAAIGVAFHDFGLHRLEANIQPGNQASIALVRRLGFQREGFSQNYLRISGEWRDHERWALVFDPSDAVVETTQRTGQPIC
ncbi:GNAT family N-acetyltransferase [Paraburkholderia sp. MM6662-R1]|uniref:GNAT family N-acetyltransferase n=1 Tax=Paraburkholderia sp. MM6662-R1 TaxID=2991066 RepID=UPI003D1BBAE1